MTGKLNEMNGTLIGVAEKLDVIESEMKTATRKLETQNMSAISGTFYDNYLKEMKSFFTTYQDYINAGFRIWYLDGEKSAINIQDYAITLDGASVNKAMNGAVFSVNTYRNEIIDNFAEEIISQADAGKLTADDSFYTDWNNSTEVEKNAKAADIAEKCFNTLSSFISTKQMKAHSDFVSKVYDAFCSYCEKLTIQGSPLEAQIKVLCLTHAFEGEVTDEIDNILDTYTTITGSYAALTLTIMKQDDEMQSENRLDIAKNAWTSVNNYIEAARSSTVTGYDNFCYLTNSLVTLETRDLKYENSIDSRFDYSGSYDRSAYTADSFRTEDLLEKGDKIMAPCETSMLYALYLQNPSDCESFYGFLEKEDTGATEDTCKRLVTEYDGWCSFDPSDGISMDYGHGATGGGRSYWGDTFKVIVNSGNNSDVDSKCFKNCKKATATVFDPDKGTSTCKQTIGAMATYEEDHWYWAKDEMYIMGQADQCDFTNNYSYGYFAKYHHDVNHFTTTCAVLVLSPVQEKTETTFANPLTAFDECQVVTDYNDVTPAEHIIDSGTDVNTNPEEKILPNEETSAISDVEKTEDDAEAAESAETADNTEAAENTEEKTSTPETNTYSGTDAAFGNTDTDADFE